MDYDKIDLLHLRLLYRHGAQFSDELLTLIERETGELPEREDLSHPRDLEAMAAEIAREQTEIAPLAPPVPRAEPASGSPAASTGTRQD